MNKKALLAICIAVLIPLVSYLLVKNASDNAVVMPRHYLPDSITCYGVDADNWWLLTGAKDSIYNFIFQELKVDKYESNGPLDPNFAHTQRFVLLDKTFRVRGFYNGLDTTSLAALSKDIGLLMLEKATNPEPLPFDPLQMGVFFALTLIIVVVVVSILFKKRKVNNS